MTPTIDPNTLLAIALLPLAAVLLLVAIVAAITLTLRQRPGLKPQDVAKQVAVRREDRVRLVKDVDAAGTGPGADQATGPRQGKGGEGA